MASNSMRDIISIGECMIELARRSDGAFEMRVGGDTYNTAIYLARLGADISYMTAVGDDPYSELIVQTALSEKICTQHIVIAEGRMPGLYLIETEAGERRFWYWRERSPARDLFELPGTAERCISLAGAKIIYLSGITLSLYPPAGLDKLAAALAEARQQGGRVVMDSNFRPAGWFRDTARARAVYERFWALADIALPSFDDEQALWGDATTDETLNRFAAFGCDEVCLKLAGDGAMTAWYGESDHVRPERRITPVDSTAAGDSFSAAYLWARLAGLEPKSAAIRGNRLAAVVIQHPGAIVPHEATARIITTH